jgi:ABC-type amino acid transport substrate-binding protein
MYRVTAGGFLLAGLVASGASATDLKEVKSAGTLRVLAIIDEREPEFLGIKGGVPSGFDLEILEAFVKSQHLELKLVPVGAWEALIPALIEQKGDIIAGRFTATASRAKRVAFTEEVFPTRTVIVTRRPRPPVQSLEALGQEKVGTIRGTSMVESLAAAGFPMARLDQSLVSGGLIDALRGSKVTAAVWSVEGAMLARRQDPELELGAFVGPSESLAYAVRQEDTELKRSLNDHLRTIRRTGDWNRMVVKHFGEAAPAILKKAREQ